MKTALSCIFFHYPSTCYAFIHVCTWASTILFAYILEASSMINTTSERRGSWRSKSPARPSASMPATGLFL